MMVVVVRVTRDQRTGSVVRRLDGAWYSPRCEIVGGVVVEVVRGGGGKWRLLLLDVVIVVGVRG